MIKHIHCLGTSFTEGGGFEWWRYEEVKEIYKVYEEIPKEHTQFPFSYPGQLKKLIEEYFPIVKGIDYIHNHGRCGWGNQRVHRKVMEIVTQGGFKPKEHLFLIEFSDDSRAEFWSVEKQKHFLINYDYGSDEPGYERIGDLYKEDVHPIFDYHRKTFEDEEEWSKSIAPMMTEYLRKTCDHTDVMRRIEQNQVFFCSFMESMKLNWLVPMPNPIVWNPKWYRKFYKGRIIEPLHNGGLQYSYPSQGYGFKDETHGLWLDHHGGLAWSEMVAAKTFNLISDWGYFDGIGGRTTNRPKVDVSEKTLRTRKLQIRKQIGDRLPELKPFVDELKGFRSRGGVPKEQFYKRLI
jgi:hypothetical protein